MQKWEFLKLISKPENTYLQNLMFLLQVFIISMCALMLKCVIHIVNDDIFCCI